ncbi:MAG TPA: DUF3466 family protein [Chthonomonadaceae bacterium]|nr:DUF3466 family protein [Chthonomonadaceae bacterium]
MKRNYRSIGFVGSIMLAVTLALVLSGSLRHAATSCPRYTIEDLGELGSSTGQPFSGPVVMPNHFPLPTANGLPKRDAFTLQRTWSDADTVRVISANKSYGQAGWIHTQGMDAWHAFLLHNGQLEDLGTLGGNSSFACDLNAYGWVVGYSQTPDRSRHAFLFQGSLMADLGTLGGVDSRAYGVNDQGQIVGDADTTQGASHAFLYEQGHLSDLGTLGGLDSVAYSLNNKGQVVGFALTRRGDTHAFLWQQGTMYDLNRQIPADSGWELQEALKIDDAGRIWGEGMLHDKLHRFLLIPR